MYVCMYVLPIISLAHYMYWLLTYYCMGFEMFSILLILLNVKSVHSYIHTYVHTQHIIASLKFFDYCTYCTYSMTMMSSSVLTVCVSPATLGISTARNTSPLHIRLRFHKTCMYVCMCLRQVKLEGCSCVYCIDLHSCVCVIIFALDNHIGTPVHTYST